MEKKTIRSGAPFVLAGLAVLAAAVILGIGSLLSYLIAAAAGAAAFAAGKKMFPVRVVEVERGPQSGNAEVDALILEARAQLDEIAQANHRIADPALSAQIEDIENTCRKILLRLEEQPDRLSSLRTFLRYYLPATLKLLSERARIEHEVEAGENAQIAARISGAMSKVQAAFAEQLSALDEFRFINLESEMDVLSDMLSSDGLLGKDEEEQTPGKEEQEADPFAGLFKQEG